MQEQVTSLLISLNLQVPLFLHGDELAHGFIAKIHIFGRIKRLNNFLINDKLLRLLHSTPVKPAGQMHSYDPILFRQIELFLHGFSSNVHSSTSLSH
jgi:hypothetical protein